MAKVYNRSFMAGALVTIFVFVIANIVDAIWAYQAFDANPIKLSGDGPAWGFPFDWARRDGSGLDVILNASIVIATAFVVGFISRLIFDRRRIE